MRPIRARELRISADSIVVESPRSDGPPTRPSRLYRFNLVLLVVLLIALMTWFEVHLKTYFAETIFVGGTLTVFGLWKIVQSWTKWGVNDDFKAFATRVMGTATATELLTLGSILVIILFVTTSSIYITLDAAPRGEDEFEVEVLRRRVGTDKLEKVMGNLVVSSDHKIAGRPFLLSTASDYLVFHIVKPHGYQTVSRTRHPWSSVHVPVPGQTFIKRQLHVVTIVPGVGLVDELPKVGEDSGDRWYVRIESTGRPPVEKQGILYQRIIVGAPEDDLQWVDQKPLSRDLLTGYLINNNVTDPETREGYFVHWENDPMLVPTHHFQPGEVITVTIGEIDVRAAKRSNALTSRFKIGRKDHFVHFF